MSHKVCSLCREKINGNFGNEADFLICDSCFIKLTNILPAVLDRAIKVLEERGNLKKANILKYFVEKKVTRRKYGNRKKNNDRRESRITYRN